jgi:hypothetical protein
MSRPHAVSAAPTATVNYDPVTDRLSSVVGYFDVLSAKKQISG